MHISNLEYFSNWQILREPESISDRNLEAYINHLVKMREDFKIHFGDLDNVHVNQ